MEIRIGGRLLDIEPQEVTMQWRSYVFADAIGDQFSTDITLPRTQNNTDILKPFGVLDGVTTYNRRIPCAVSIDFVGVDGYLQVSALAKYEISATLYLSPFPYSLVDKKIKDIIHDQSYVREWDLKAPTTYVSGHGNGLQRSVFIDGANRHPIPWSLRYSEFLAALSTATGVSLNLPLTDICRVVAATPKVSPYNSLQSIYAYEDVSETPNIYRMHASQHVCTDIESPRESVEEITITRDCTGTFTMYSGPYDIQVNGSVVYTDYTFYSPTSPSPTFTYNFNRGDKLVVFFQRVSPTVYDGAALIQWSNYTVEDGDGGDELIFPGLIANYDGTLKEVPSVYGVDCDGVGGRVRLSWAYMDYWWCLGDMTFRTLINSLCHLAGAGVVSDGNSLSFSAGTTAIIDGEVTEIITAPQEVGQATLLKWGKNSNLADQQLDFPSDFLAESVTVFTSLFYGAKAAVNSAILPAGAAVVPLFELQDDPDTTHAVKWQDCGAVMLVEADGYDRNGNLRYFLAPLPPQKWCGVDEIETPVEVEVVTLTDLRGVDYFYLEGRKYINVSAEVDLSTGFCYAVGILCKSK